MAERSQNGVARSRAIPTISNVPTTALPKPPPVMPAAGGSSVNTLQLNSGSPFFKNEEDDRKQWNERQRARGLRKFHSKTCSKGNERQRARSSPTQRSRWVVPLSLCSAMVVLLLAYSCSLLLRVAQNGFSGDVHKQSQHDQQKSRVHQRTHLQPLGLTELVGEESRQRARG